MNEKIIKEKLKEMEKYGVEIAYRENIGDLCIEIVLAIKEFKYDHPIQKSVSEIAKLI